MTTRGATILILALFAVTLGYVAIVYPHLPDQIPIHWNIRGEIDGWAPKSAILYGPGLVLAGLVMLYLLPALSPRHFQIEPFRATFNFIVFIVSGLFAFMAFTMVRAALHPDIPMGRTLTVGISLFLAAMGNPLGKTRRNFYMGVRTPWTLASDRVWIRTHRLAGRLLVGAGLLSAALAMLGAPLSACFTLVIVAAVYPVLFSYTEYKRLERTGDL